MKERSSASKYDTCRFGKPVTKAYLDTCMHVVGESECNAIVNLAPLDHIETVNELFVYRISTL